MIIAVLMDDQPGGLHTIADAFAVKGINIEDAYGFVVQDKKKAVMILDVEEVPEAVKVLSEYRMTILDDAELYAL